MVAPYFSTATAATIETAIQRAKATRALLTNTTTTFTRIDKDTGALVNVVTNAPLIAITLANRDVAVTGITQGATEAASYGEFEVWAPAAIRRGDRFSWNGALCQVLAVGMAQHGSIKGQFELLKGVA